jgi:Protein of unknown function (DUF2877)
MIAIQGIPHVNTIRCGNRAIASGKGIPLYRSKRTVNLQFGRKVVTICTGPGVLSPSSILVDLPALPDVEEALFEGNIISTDTFQVKLGFSVDLHFDGPEKFDASRAFRLLHPWIETHDHSIVKAMLINLYDLDISSHGPEKDIVTKQERVLRESGSLEELVNNLLGIGYGLTPSGDDFILGIIAFQSLAGKDLTGLYEIIHNYDNPFSRTILEDACEGCFSEPLLALMNHLAHGNCPSDAVKALLSVGSTSGWDTLAGIFYSLHHVVFRHEDWQV